MALGLWGSAHGLKIIAAGTNGTAQGRSDLLAALRAALSLDGVYGEASYLMARWSVIDMQVPVVPFLQVEALFGVTANPITIRRPTAQELEEAIGSGVLPDTVEVRENAYVRFIDAGGGASAIPIIKVMVGRPVLPTMN